MDTHSHHQNFTTRCIPISSIHITTGNKTTTREGDEEESIAHTESGGRGHGDTEAATEREQGEQDEVPGVLLPVLEHGEHDCTNQRNQTEQNRGGYDPNPRNGRREGGTEARARTDERGDEDDDERVRANCRDMMP